MLTRQEREQAVLDLYNKGKTIREIAKDLRISFRDIGAVLKKEENEKERQKKQQDNNSSAYGDSTQSGVSLSTQAYKLFSQGKTPVEAATELDLSEKRATKYYKEYWKLNSTRFMMRSKMISYILQSYVDYQRPQGRMRSMLLISSILPITIYQHLKTDMKTYNKM